MGVVRWRVHIVNTTFTAEENVHQGPLVGVEKRKSCCGGSHGTLQMSHRGPRHPKDFPTVLETRVNLLHLSCQT